MQVVGVDGCPGGWLAVPYDPGARTLVPRVHPSFADILAAYPDASCIAIDIPIGLMEGEPRRCDVEARRLLAHRHSSVFPAPDPRVLTATGYAEASRLARPLTGKGISKQGHAIYTKVTQVNRAMSPVLQSRVVEIHREVSFSALGGRPMDHPKRTPEGFAERHALLDAAIFAAIPDRNTARALARPATADDILDAIAAAWTAHRFATGQAGRLPEVPQTDAHGLRVEIVY
ncbi:MAG: DUF429 domain-containing protein [Chloroflexota bacterium]|nr:DUF429 domain-containing protein [Chloroflexota bacterium]